MTVRGEEDTPFASAVRRATLLTVSGIVPADLERQIRAGNRPRPDYVELANAMDAEILDVAAARRQAGVVGRFVAWFGVGPLLAWVCFRQRRRYSAIVTDDGELLADDPLERLARRFDPSLFIRVHRSAFINLSLLAELVHEGDRRYVAVLADAAATRIPVSRERLPALEAALGLS